MIRVLVWNEFAHEKIDERVKLVYPNGIHQAIADFLGKEEDIEVRTATLDDPDCGITAEVLGNTDVLLWWGHMKHGCVPDEVANLVKNAVDKGMGFIPLHSGHHSKPFKALCGTSGNLGWAGGYAEIVHTVNPGHPIAQGLDGTYFMLEEEEVYSEPFDIPQPDELVFVSWFADGSVFRSGCCFYRGRGRIFYFQPGHEEYPTFYNPNVQTVIKNAVRWAAPIQRVEKVPCKHIAAPYQVCKDKLEASK